MTTNALPFRPYPEAKPLGPIPVDEDPLVVADSDVVQLYEHRKRPEWGLAMFVRERDGRSDYQFQDGEMRSIAGDFAHLLVEVDRPAIETATAVQELRTLSGEALARTELAAQPGPRPISFDEQLDWFVQQYPDGFEDPQWRSKVRGIDQKRRLKAHRGAAIAEAQSQLAASELEQLLDQLRPDEIVARALQVLQGTSLVSKTQLRPLQGLDAAQQGLIGRALRDLIHGEEDLELRFAKLTQAFRATPAPLSWSAATALLGLVHPQTHICVRPSIMTEQARWMAPMLRLPNEPDGRTYGRLRDVVVAIRDELAKRGFSARDLMDVYDFIWTTLRPAACKAIRNRPPMPRASQVRQVEGG